MRLWPRNLLGQLLLAVALTLFVAQAANMWLLARGRDEARLLKASGPAVGRIIDSIDRMDNGLPVSGRAFRDPDERERRGGPHLDDHDGPRARQGSGDSVRPARVVLLNSEPVQDAGAREWPELAARVQLMLADAQVPVTAVKAWRGTGGREGRIGKALFRRDRIAIAAQLDDGRWLLVRGGVGSDDGPFSAMLLVQTLVIYLLLLGPLLWIGWRVARPLRALTVAAQGPVIGGDATPLPQSGPADVRALTGAFNNLRARVTAMLSDKDRMLGAIGHDLRTPLASLRVRVEQVGDEGLRDKMIDSITEMTAMLADIMALARAGQGVEMPQRVNVAGLMSGLADDYRELGRAVVWVGGDTAFANLRVVPMRRALRNLIDNALSYGERARLSVSQDGGQIHMVVSDDGPGIPADRIADMLEPFARAETSRNRDTGGAGLGLSLAKMVVEIDGGTLALRNREGGGLDAVVTVPKVNLED